VRAVREELNQGPLISLRFTNDWSVFAEEFRNDGIACRQEIIILLHGLFWRLRRSEDYCTEIRQSEHIIID